MPGDEDTSTTFDALYRAECTSMARLAFALTGSIEAAEDLTQEAFARLQPRWETITNPPAYLRMTVVNLSNSWHRTQKRERDLLPRVYVDHVVTSDARELLDVLAAMPYRYRTVLVLRYWADWRETEIAEAIGARPGTVKSLASRGLARLRRQLGESL